MARPTKDDARHLLMKAGASGMDTSKLLWRLLSLDPSLTATGYALLGRNHEGKLVVADAGIIRPEKAKAPTQFRVDAICGQVREVIREHSPSTVIVECPTHKQHTRQAHKLSGLPLWGMLSGAVYATCREMSGAPLCVDMVSNEWTRGTTKLARQRQIAAIVNSYHPTLDRGADVSDAIAMALWWLDEGAQRAGAMK